jgi:hypothetical protein
MTKIRITVEYPDGKTRFAYLTEDDLCILSHAITAYKPLKVWAPQTSRLVTLFQRITKGFTNANSFPLIKTDFKASKRPRK